MLVVDASVLVDALLIDGTARARLAEANLQAPDLIDAEVLSVLRRLVLAERIPEQHALKALAACLGASGQPQRLRRALRGPGRTAGHHLAHRRCPCSPGTRPALPCGGDGPMSGHLTLAPGKVTRSTRRSSERLHLGAARQPHIQIR